MRSEREWRKFWAELSPDDVAMAAVCGPLWIALAWEKDKLGWVRYGLSVNGITRRILATVSPVEDAWTAKGGGHEFSRPTCDSAMDAVDEVLKAERFVMCDKLTEREALAIVNRT